MKIHEYQEKKLFLNHNIAVPDGCIATDPYEASTSAMNLGRFPVVRPSQ